MAHVINPFTGKFDLAGVVVEEMTRAPNSTDIRRIGSEVLNTHTNKYYKLIDVTDGIASWQEVTAGSMDFEESIIAIVDASAPPPTEQLEDRYLLDTTGVVHPDWDGANHNDIVEWGGVFWNIYTPSRGTMVYNHDDTTLYVFDGTWETISEAIPEASTTVKGVASFNDSYFSVTSGVVSLDANVVNSITTDTGAMTITGNAVSILGGDAIEVTHAATTITVDVNDTLKSVTGFNTWGGAGNYFDDTTLGTFELLRPGTGAINSKEIAWTAPQSVTGLTAGNTYYIYIDDTGTIQKTAVSTHELYKNNIVLFETLRDSTAVTNVQYTVQENHPCCFNVDASNYLHDVVGTVIADGGGNITLNGTQKLEIVGDTFIHDHGLETELADSAGLAVTFNKMFTLASGKWATFSQSDTFTGNYNNAGTVTALGGSKFGVYTIYASKSNLNTDTPVFYAVLDNAQYNNQTAAVTAINDGLTAVASNELIQLEMVQLGYIVFGQTAAAIVQVIVAKTSLRATVSSGGTGGASLVGTNITNFNGILSSSDTTVQQALETIDDLNYLPITAAPGSNLTASGIKIRLVANENQAFGDVCKIASDGETTLAKADVIGNAGAVVMCVDATISAGATGNFLLSGIARQDTWNWTVGGYIYLTITGTTGATLSQTAPVASGNVVQILGVATHSDRMMFMPNLCQVELV
jgi:hypothetical protein